MRTGIKLFLLFVLATVCHWAFALGFGFWGISTNLMLVFTLAFCTVLKPSFGYPMALLCGLFLDFFGTKVFGNNACSFIVASCIMYHIVPRFDFEGIFPQMLAVFFLTCLTGMLSAWLVWKFSSSVLWPGIGSILLGALIGAICSPAVFWLVQEALQSGPMCKTQENASF